MDMCKGVYTHTHFSPAKFYSGHLMCNLGTEAVCACVLSHFIHVLLLEILWTITSRLFCPWGSPGKNTGMGSLTLLQEIFPFQEWNRGLLHCRQILYHRATKKALICLRSMYYYMRQKNLKG